MSAARDNESEALEKLLQCPHNPNVTDTDGKTPTALHIAAQNGHAEVVFLLIGVGLDVDRAETSATGGTGLSSLCGPFGSCTRAD